MSTIAKENLDERIERIKKRNEEIEKKYREAEEDRLRALKENAMVETKPPKDDDWPRTHKYDKLDFTYDVKREKLEEMNSQKLAEEKKQKRDYKKFPEGEGPPPDPAYNFLADAERDGLIIQRPEKGKDKDSKQSGNNKNKDQQRRGGPNAGSFRGRGGKANNSPKYQKQNSQPDYEQWRSEREKIDEARINRQKAGEGKWRREWDNDKLNSENEALLRPERATLGDAIINTKKSPTHHQSNMTEKRGNITVSVSQTGEVKSVKLTSAPVIGTGRVGPRQVTKPQFSIQAVEKELIVAKAPQSPKPQHKIAHRSNTNPNLNHNQNNKNIIRRDGPTAPLNTNQIVANNNPANAVKIQPVPNPVKSQQAPLNPVKNVKPQKPKSPKPGVTIAPIVPTTLPIIPPAAISPLIADLSPERASELIKLDLSHKPEFAKKSVQDRLIRIRQATNSNEGGETVGEIGEICEETGENSVDCNNTDVDTTLNNQDEKVISEINADTNEMITSEKDEKSNDSKDAKADGGESSASPESNTNNCDQSNVSATSSEVGGEEPIETCDKNTPESIIQVTSAAEAVAAN